MVAVGILRVVQRFRLFGGDWGTWGRRGVREILLVRVCSVWMWTRLKLSVVDGG